MQFQQSHDALERMARGYVEAWLAACGDTSPMNAEALLSESAIEAFVVRSLLPQNWRPSQGSNLSARAESVVNAHMVAVPVAGCFDNA
jgi:hypothetical protein